MSDDLLGWSVYESWIWRKRSRRNHRSSNSDTNRNFCDGRGWITRDTYLIHIQRTILKIRLSIGKNYLIQFKICHVYWKSKVVGQHHWTTVPTYVTNPRSAFCQSLEPKTSIWWSKKQRTISLVDTNQQLFLYWKLKIIHKNTAES